MKFWKTLKKYLKRLLLLYALSYFWGMLKEKTWEKGKKSAKKEIK